MEDHTRRLYLEATGSILTIPTYLSALNER